MTFDPEFGKRPRAKFDPRFEPAGRRYSSPLTALGFLIAIVAIMVGASFFFSDTASRTETASMRQPAPAVTAPITQQKPAETTGSGGSSR